MVNLILALFFSFSIAEEYLDTNQDFDTFQQIVNSSQAQSVDHFLEELKQKQPYMFQNYLLGYRSRSLQQSSILYPRVVLFNTRADLSIAFNGHQSHRGYNNVEVMRFDHEEKRFEFFELSFSKDGKPSGLDKPNPKKCLECHQSIQRKDVDPRPNWEAYATWPGFYGSLDDRRDVAQTKINLKYHLKIPEEDRSLIYDSLDEEKNLQTFTTYVKPGHPRYRLLEPLSRLTYNNDGTKTDRREPNRTNNAPYTEALARLNFKRVLRLMQQNKEVYALTKWSLFNMGECYDTMIEQSESYAFLKSMSPRVDSNREFEAASHDDGFMKGLGSWVSPAINYFFEPFGIDTEDWSMDFKTDGGRFAFGERFGTQRFTHRAFVEENEAEWLKDKELLPYLVRLKKFRDDYDAVMKLKWSDEVKQKKDALNQVKRAICNEIDVKVQATVGDLNKVKALYQQRKKLMESQPSNEKPLIQRCIGCHAESYGSDAPYIPFDDENKLRQALVKGSYRRGRLIDEISFRTGSYATSSEQMPPRGVPTTKQRQELINYLNSLIKN